MSGNAAELTIVYFLFRYFSYFFLAALTLSPLRVINVNFPLQPQQKCYITQYEELGFSLCTQMKDDYATNSSLPHSYIALQIVGRMYTFFSLGVKGLPSLVWLCTWNLSWEYSPSLDPFVVVALVVFVFVIGIAAAPKTTPFSSILSPPVIGSDSALKPSNSLPITHLFSSTVTSKSVTLQTTHAPGNAHHVIEGLLITRVKTGGRCIRCLRAHFF